MEDPSQWEFTSKCILAIKKILNNNVNRENLYRKPIKNMHKSLDLLNVKKNKIREFVS